MTRKRTFALVAVAVLAVAFVVWQNASSAVATGERSAGDYAAEFGGPEADFDQILHELSCLWLDNRLATATRAYERAEPGSAEQRYDLGVITAVKDRQITMGFPLPSPEPGMPHGSC